MNMLLTTPEAANVLRALEDIRDFGPRSPGCGICHNLTDTPMEVSRYRVKPWLLDTFSGWGLDRCYPVRGESTTADEAMGEYTWAKQHMWDGRHPYGAARLHLLDRLIERLEQQLEGTE